MLPYGGRHSRDVAAVSAVGCIVVRKVASTVVMHSGRYRVMYSGGCSSESQSWVLDQCIVVGTEVMYSCNAQW